MCLRGSWPVHTESGNRNSQKKTQKNTWNRRYKALLYTGHFGSIIDDSLKFYGHSHFELFFCCPIWIRYAHNHAFHWLSYHMVLLKHYLMIIQLNLRDRDNLRTKDKRPVPKVSFVRSFDSRTSHNGPSEKRTTSLLWTNAVLRIETRGLQISLSAN